MKIICSLISALTVSGQKSPYFAVKPQEINSIYYRPEFDQAGSRARGPPSENIPRPPPPAKYPATIRPTTRPTMRPTTRPTMRPTTIPTEPATTENVETTEEFAGKVSGPGDDEKKLKGYNKNNQYNNNKPASTNQYNNNKPASPSQYTNNKPASTNQNNNNKYKPPSNQYQTQYQQYQQTGGSQGYAQGDPHFMVETEGQAPLCFDFNPQTGDDLILFADPVSGLLLTATLEENAKGAQFMTTVHFRSPEGASLRIGLNGVIEEGEGPEPISGQQEYKDIIFKSHWDEKGVHQHTRIKIKEGPIFAVRSNMEKSNLQVSVEKATGVSEKTKGVIGLFTKPNSYVISPKKKRTPNGEIVASVFVGGHEFNGLLEDFHMTKDCWVVGEMDALKMFSLV